MKSPQQPEQHLLFDWQVRDRGGARMVMALLIAGGVIAALAIGFRVITPSVPPVMTRRQLLMVL